MMSMPGTMFAMLLVTGLLKNIEKLEINRDIVKIARVHTHSSQVQVVSERGVSWVSNRVAKYKRSKVGLQELTHTSLDGNLMYNWYPTNQWQRDNRGRGSGLEVFKGRGGGGRF